MSFVFVTVFPLVFSIAVNLTIGFLWGSYRNIIMKASFEPTIFWCGFFFFYALSSLIAWIGVWEMLIQLRPYRFLPTPELLKLCGVISMGVGFLTIYAIMLYTSRRNRKKARL